MGCVCGRPSSSFDDGGQFHATPPPAAKLSAAVRREEEARKQQQHHHHHHHARTGSGREEALERRRAMMAMAAACQVRSPVPRAVEVEQVTAGWPPWLVAVAPEAVRGWVPRRAKSFEKLDKVGPSSLICPCSFVLFSVLFCSRLSQFIIAICEQMGISKIVQ
jgi:cyclin-dependent kinase 12/13